MRVSSTLICQFVRATSSHHRPWQIAMAVTLGGLLGVLSQSLTLFVIIGVLCYLTPIHLPLLALTAITTALATPLLEATMGRIGLWSLTHPQMSEYWLRLDSFPLTPWLGIHNTVVHGSLMLWLASTLPVYFSCMFISRALMMDEVGNEVIDILNSSEAIKRRPNDVAYVQEIRAVTAASEFGAARTIEAPPVVIWDDINYSSHDGRKARIESHHFPKEASIEFDSSAPILSTDAILRRAADTAAWAEELIADELLMDSPNSPEPANGNAISGSHGAKDQYFDEQERWLIETTMEVVCIAERAVANQAAVKNQTGNAYETRMNSDDDASSEIRSANPTQDSIVKFQQISDSMGSHNSITTARGDSQFPELNIRREQASHYDHRSHLDMTRAGLAVGTKTPAVNQPREEALHYLLRHLRGIQEKAQKQ